MGYDIQQTLFASIIRLLRPLVRLLLRNGVSYGAFSDVAKRLFVEVAMDEFGIPGRKSTISRASVITGLSRKEVLRVTRLPRVSDQDIVDRYNRAVRVVSGWRRDETFLDPSGEPLRLPLEGDGVDFGALVRKYSGDLPPRAILDELLRSGSVERLESGDIRLLSSSYGPQSGMEDKLAILGTDVADLVETIDHNLVHSGSDSRLQLKVAYDNLPRESLEHIREISREQGFGLLKSLDREYAHQDRDANPAATGSGRMRAGLAVYYFEEDLTGDEGLS